MTHCFFQATFGVPGPACGMTRAFVALAQGAWQTALMYHAFAPLIFLGCLWLGASNAVEFIVNRSLWRYDWLTQRLSALVFIAPITGIGFFSYYGLRLYVRYHPDLAGASIAQNPIWQQFVLGAKLL
jgi:Protein of unknown function (DUF2752)